MATAATGTSGSATGLSFDPLGIGTFQTIAGNLTRPTFWQRLGIGALGIAFIWWSILFALASNKQVQGLAKTALKSNPETAIPATIAETAIGS
jgi:hypothetical protein